MNAQQANTESTRQQNAVIDEQSCSVWTDNGTHAAYVEALLDQVDAAQLQIQHLQEDLSLLQTAENALDLISENLARIRRLVTEKHTGLNAENSNAAILDEIRNLLMINMLIAEDTELNGHYLFRDDIIRMHCDTTGELTLTTTRIPEITGLDNNDTQATLDSLNSAARTINRQYERVSSLMRALLNHYRQLQSEATLLMTARQTLKQSD